MIWCPREYQMRTDTHVTTELVSLSTPSMVTLLSCFGLFCTNPAILVCSFLTTSWRSTDLVRGEHQFLKLKPVQEQCFQRTPSYLRQWRASSTLITLAFIGCQLIREVSVHTRVQYLHNIQREIAKQHKICKPSCAQQTEPGAWVQLMYVSK